MTNQLFPLIAKQFAESFINFDEAAVIESAKKNGIGAGLKKFLESGLHGPLALGNVACDFPKAKEKAVFVLESGDNDVGPEAGTVFADAPALIFKAPLRGGDFQLVSRFSPFDVFGRIKNREMAATNFVERVSLDAFRALVPGRDMTLGVKQKDGVVFEVLHQQLEQLLMRGVQRAIGLRFHGFASHKVNGPVFRRIAVFGLSSADDFDKRIDIGRFRCIRNGHFDASPLGKLVRA